MTRILVADDSEPIRLLLRKRLEHAGFQVSLANDGVETVRSVAEDAPDLILLDAMMPRMSGLEALQELRGSGSSCPIVMVSAHRDTAELAEALDSGADATVGKPIDWDELISTIRRLTGAPPA